MILKSQLPERFRSIIIDELDKFEQKIQIKSVEEIPNTTNIPIEHSKQEWIRIPGVICLFVDMKGSTKLSASSHDKSTARAYQLFTGTAVRIFHEFEAPYIDVKGDGVFALFNRSRPYTALASAITFKTFAHEVFKQKIKERTGKNIGCHMGIDQKTLLVRRIGLKAHKGRTDRQNEVWAGKTVNMAAKLAGRSNDNQLLVSDRFFAQIENHARYKCGCRTILTGKKGLYWEEWYDFPFFNSPFDFNEAYSLEDNWCEKHGEVSCNFFLNLDRGNFEGNELTEKEEKIIKGFFDSY